MRCKEFQGSASVMNLDQTEVTNRVFKASAAVNTSTSSIALIPECGRGTSRTIKQPKTVRPCLITTKKNYFFIQKFVSSDFFFS